MKTLASVVLISSLILACAYRAYGADAKNDPSQFPLVVHISASTYAPSYMPEVINTAAEILTATIDGKHYQLRSPTFSAGSHSRGNGLLSPGDYHARLARDDHKTSYEFLQDFEILFPDGTARRFPVIAQSE